MSSKQCLLVVIIGSVAVAVVAFAVAVIIVADAVNENFLVPEGGICGRPAF